MKLKTLLGLSALLVASCAAFFSVTGLGLLFHGASISVMVMAVSLEISKLVSAAYLKQKWSELEKTLKTYLTLAVLVLMFITSLGIFGFLSDAFQQQSIQIAKVERQISVYDNKIKINTTEINRHEQKINNLTQVRSSQEANLTKLIDKEKGTSRLSSMIRNADQDIRTSSVKIDSLNTLNTQLYQAIDSVKNQNIDLEKQVGGFRFVAEAFGVELKVAVKYFIFLIVFVFDPLAIALILAYNSVKRREKDEVVVEEEKPKPTLLKRLLKKK